MADEQLRVTSILPELLAITTKITYDFKPTNFYYLIDLYQTYRSKFKTKSSLQQFFNLVNNNDSVIILEAKNIGSSLVSEKKKFDRALGQKIKQNDMQITKIDNQSDSDSSLEIQVKSVIKNAIKKENPPAKRLNDLSYDETREIIINSFQQGIICPISSLNQATIEVYGSAFDFKNARCKKGKHSHGSLLKFLNCWDDTVEIKRFGIPYIKRKDFDAISILEKRKRLHFSQINSADFDYHIELLIVNMFPTKVTIEYQDLLTVFENVYNRSLKSFFREEPRIYLSKMNSENIRIVYHNQRITVTMIPSWYKEYKNFGDIATFMKVQEQNLKTFSTLASVSEKIPEKVNLDKIDTNYLKLLKEIFSDDKVVEVAALNVPKNIQLKNICSEGMDLFKRCEKNGGIDFMWSFINENLRIAE